MSSCLVASLCMAIALRRILKLELSAFEHLWRTIKYEEVCLRACSSVSDDVPVQHFFSSLKREWTGVRFYRTRRSPLLMCENMWRYYNARCLHDPWLHDAARERKTPYKEC